MVPKPQAIPDDIFQDGYKVNKKSNFSNKNSKERKPVRETSVGSAEPVVPYGSQSS